MCDFLRRIEFEESQNRVVRICDAQDARQFAEWEAAEFQSGFYIVARFGAHEIGGLVLLPNQVEEGAA